MRRLVREQAHQRQPADHDDVRGDPDAQAARHDRRGGAAAGGSARADTGSDAAGGRQRRHRPVGRGLSGAGAAGLTRRIAVSLNVYPCSGRFVIND